MQRWLISYSVTSIDISSTLFLYMSLLNIVNNNKVKERKVIPVQDIRVVVSTTSLATVHHNARQLVLATHWLHVFWVIVYQFPISCQSSNWKLYKSWCVLLEFFNLSFLMFFFNTKQWQKYLLYLMAYKMHSFSKTKLSKKKICLHLIWLTFSLRQWLAVSGP